MSCDAPSTRTKTFITTSGGRSIAFTAIASALLLLGCQSVKVAAPPDVPAALRVPASETLTAKARAVGAQIYTCSARKGDPSRYEWTLKAPEADLFDDQGKKIGTHYAGPTWEGNDRSKAVGEVVSRDPGPDETAIPWLLLKAKSATGGGLFGSTQSVQRLATVGGKAPATGCDATRLGQEARVGYSATYYFYAGR